MSCQLKTTENKENYEVSHMDARCSWVGAEIERDGLLQRLAELFLIGGLRNKAAPFKVID